MTKGFVGSLMADMVGKQAIAKSAIDQKKNLRAEQAAIEALK